MKSTSDSSIVKPSYNLYSYIQQEPYSTDKVISEKLSDLIWKGNEAMHFTDIHKKNEYMDTKFYSDDKTTNTKRVRIYSNKEEPYTSQVYNQIPTDTNSVYQSPMEKEKETDTNYYRYKQNMSKSNYTYNIENNQSWPPNYNKRQFQYEKQIYISKSPKSLWDSQTFNDKIEEVEDKQLQPYITQSNNSQNTMLNNEWHGSKFPTFDNTKDKSKEEYYKQDGFEYSISVKEDIKRQRATRKVIRPSKISCCQLHRLMPYVMHQLEVSKASRKELCRQLTGQLYPNSPKPSPNFLLNTLLPVFRAANYLGFDWKFHMTASLSYLRLWVCSRIGGRDLLQKFRVEYNAPTGKYSSSLVVC